MANVSLASSLPASTLERIAPQRGGVWFITDQAENHFTLAYVMDQGTRAVAFRMYPCITEKDIFSVCESEVYRYNIDAQDGNSNLQAETRDQPLHLILRPHQAVTVEQTPILQDFVGTTQNSDPGKDQMATVTQDEGSLQLEESLFNVQGRQDNETGEFDWSTTAELFDNITPMVTNEASQDFHPLFDHNLILRPDLNGTSSSAGNATLTNGNNEGFMEWSTFLQS